MAPFSPWMPISRSLVRMPSSAVEGGKEEKPARRGRVPTAGNVLAADRLDGISSGLRVRVHTHADAVALVDTIDVQVGEGGVAGHQGHQDQQVREFKMHDTIKHRNTEFTNHRE